MCREMKDGAIIDKVSIYSMTKLANAKIIQYPLVLLILVIWVHNLFDFPAAWGIQPQPIFQFRFF